jgi:hypothetical protein
VGFIGWKQPPSMVPNESTNVALSTPPRIALAPLSPRPQKPV